jgi:formylmethanofuran dehydrogenase subunit C
MKGGLLVVTGSAGQMLGARMRRGVVYVIGACGDVPGFNMKAGTIVVGGMPGVRVGARMVRGTVILLGGAPEMLPTFVRSCTCRPPVWRLLHTHLSDSGFRPWVDPEASFNLYSGDLNEGGRGEVLVRTDGAG